MFSKKEEVNFDKVETLIGKNSHFKGEILGGGTIRIDGTLEGRIAAKGDVVIGEGSTVKADIEAKNVLVAGSIEGNIVASGKLEITKTAQITGNACMGNLSVEEGAKIQGNVTIQTPTKSEKQSAKQAVE